MSQQFNVQTGKWRFNRKVGFIKGGSVRRFIFNLLILFIGVNLVVVIIAKLFVGLAK